MDDFQPPSTATQLESSLELAIDRLMRAAPTSETKRLLIEGKRLRSLMANWRSIPPSQDVRREMLARVMNLSASAAAASPMTIPPISIKRSSFRPPAQPAIARAVTQPSLAAVTAPATSSRSLVAPGIAIVRPNQLEAEQLEGVPGVDIKFLPSPGPGCLRCAVVTMSPGSELPGRDLPGGEALYVASGVARIGDHVVSAGEVCHAEPETVHVPIRTDEGCVLFVVAPDEEEPA